MSKASEVEKECTETCLNENYINTIKVRRWARQWPRLDAGLGSRAQQIMLISTILTSLELFHIYTTKSLCK